MTQPAASRAGCLAVNVQAAYRYLIHEPAELAEKRARPMLFFFHGIGERGDDLAVLSRHGITKLISQGQTLPFVVVAPQCPASDYWSDAPGLPEFVAAAIKEHRGDPQRIYLTGLSMGAFGVWSLAQRHPERYAAILPICGGGDVRWAPRLREIPIWAFHGELDKVIPPSRSIEMIEAIRCAGGIPRLTLYPHAAHDAWTETYANAEIYSWLLSHRKPTQSPTSQSS